MQSCESPYYSPVVAWSPDQKLPQGQSEKKEQICIREAKPWVSVGKHSVCVTLGHPPFCMSGSRKLSRPLGLDHMSLECHCSPWPF